MDFDVEKIAEKVKAYYGEPLAFVHGSDMDAVMTGRPRVSFSYDVTTLLSRIPEDSNLNVDSQVEAIQWLIGRCEDQFVKSWLIQERELVKKAGGVRS